MPRFNPNVQTSCRVCGSRLDLPHDCDEKTSSPRACRRCTAPMIFAPEPSVGKAKSLLLTMVGVPSYVKEHRSVEGFLRAHCPAPETVDAYRILVANLDYDAWSAMNQERQRGRKPTAVQKQEDAALTRLRARAGHDELTRRLHEAADRVKAERCAERDRCLAIFNARHGERSR